MIKIKDLDKGAPYVLCKKFYQLAISNDQKSTEVVAISSLNKNNKEIESRYVNLKYIQNDEWIFFSNYNSNKANDFKNNNYIGALFYWDSINLQIRIKATINKTSESFSDSHFYKRSNEKNALAISSDQSRIIESYKIVKSKYKRVLSDKELIRKRPTYWGGYSFTPYYFEFWKGHENRLNKREVYEKIDDNWKHLILQP